jgi:hypothetical protein
MVNDPQRISAEEVLIDQARLVVYRLERVSADSIWAHRSSGLRGELLRWIERIERRSDGLIIQPELPEQELKEIEELIASGFDMLERAARDKLGYVR